jgi:hypothetical protein
VFAADDMSTGTKADTMSAVSRKRAVMGRSPLLCP